MTKVRINKEHAYLLIVGKIHTNRVDFFKNIKFESHDAEVDLEDDEIQNLINHHEEHVMLEKDVPYHSGWVEYFTRAKYGLH